EVVAEQRERFDARPAAEDDLGPAAGDGVQRGVPLVHPDRIVGTQHGDGGAEVDPLGARRDRREHHVSGRHREILGVMLADPEEVQPGLLGQDSFLDHVADRLGMRQRLAIGVAVPVAEGVQAEGVRHARLLASWRTARSNTPSGSTAPNTGPPGSSARPARRLSRRTGSYPIRSASPAIMAAAAGASPATPAAGRSGSPAGPPRAPRAWEPR